MARMTRNDGMTVDILIADDEAPALNELTALLRADARVGEIYRASSGADALRVLSATSVGVVFLDIHMPGLSGLDLARALQQFQQQADELYPPKQRVASIENGAIDAAWLDLGTTSQRTAEHPDAHRKLLSPLQPRTGDTEPLVPSANEPLICRSNHGLGSHSCGWLFAPQFQFHLQKLKHWAEDLAELAAAQNVPLTRAKGVFRCGDKWWWLNWTPQDHSWQAIAWRRDSRCELIAADSAGEPDWQAFACSLLSTLSVDPRINN